MTKKLPPQPSLEHLANQAKDILKAYAKRDASVCARLKALKRMAKLSDTEIFGAELGLADAQFVLAMEYGFKSWAEMKKQVESAPKGKPFGKLDDLLRLNNRSIEVLLRDVDNNDLPVLLTGISPELYRRIWRNMAQNPRDRVMNHWRETGAITADMIDIVHNRVLGTANKLVDELESGGDDKGEKAMSEWESYLINELGKKPAGQRNAGELVPLFLGLVKWARREGLIAMDGFAEKHLSDELMMLGLRMTIDGADVAEINSILKAKKTTMVQAYERRLELIIAGIDGIGTGLSPEVMEEKCKAFLG